MDKLDGKSLDLTKTNVETLKQLFPEVVTEGKIDFEKLKVVLGEEIETHKEKYEFTWHGKTQSLKMAQTPSTGTLRPDKESSKNWDSTENLYIEGDNLEVLKILQKSYFGKVKMIYIDPPYNTGKDFVYKDDFWDNIKNYKKMTEQTTRANSEISGRFHTDWLNMIYPRLKLAKNLLTEDGIIAVSIDDKEMVNLRKILNEIFGEENCLAELVWDLGTGTQAGHFTRSHEYILVFAKDKNQVPNFSGGEGIIEHSALKKISAKNPSSTFKFLKGTRFDAEDGYELKGEWGGSESTKLIEGRMIAENGCLKEDVVLEAGWAMKSQMQNWFSGQETLDSKGQRVIGFYFNRNGILRYQKERSIINPPTVLKDKGSTKAGSQMVEQLMEIANPFDFPKPVLLLKFLISLVVKENEIVLDFFSGSSTMAHAVMELNGEDQGKRKFLMVQLPEVTTEDSAAYKGGFHNICEIAKERIHRAGDKIVKETGETELDIGFKVFKLDSSNVKPWDPNLENLEEGMLEQLENIKEDRTNEDLLFEILLKVGIPLTTPIEEVQFKGKVIYNVAFGSVLLCLENDIDLEIVNEMIKLKPEDFETKIIFKESGFLNDSVKTNAIQTLKKNGINDVRSV